MRYSKHLAYAERMFLRARLNRVRHITLDPDGPGVVRIHLVPCHKPDRETPFTAILNGQDILPLNVSWAILLTNFIEALKPYTGKEIRPEEWSAINAQAVAATRKIYRKTEYAQIESDLKTLVDCLCTIARGGEPPLSIEPVSLADYAPRMAAPHRMDLMVSAMEKEGRWNCNQKCLHCYAAGQPEAGVKELDTAGWKRVLEALRKAGVPQVTFTGGEPTMRADLVELVDAARWFVTRLNTNGRLLTPELCKALYEASLDSVQITLYSADEGIHNGLVGAPGFADTVAGIRSALAAGLSVSVNTPLCSLNADYAATLEFLHGLGVRYVTCSGLIPTGAALTEGSRATRLSPEELEALLRQAAAYCAENGMEIDFTSPGWLPPETLLGLGLTMAPTCGACLSNMAVAPDGTVVPCQSWLSGDGLGNILTDDWKAVWHSPRCAAIRAESAKMEHICQLREKEGAR